MSGQVMVDLVHCQTVVEEMLGDDRDLTDVEDYIDASALDELSKAGLWMLAWAHQDPAAQLQLARQRLALASALKSAATRPDRPTGTRVRK